MSLNEPRFVSPASQRLIANAGVSIERAPDNLFVVCPKMPTSALKPCYMSRICSILLDRPSRFLRLLKADGITPIFLLYFDVRFALWFVWLPPTTHGSDGTIVDMTFVDAPARPHDDLRLAGSFTLADDRMFADWPSTIPHFDGLHLFLHPGQWGTLSAVLVSEGQPSLVDPTGFLTEQFDDIDRALLQYVRRA